MRNFLLSVQNDKQTPCTLPVTAKQNAHITVLEVAERSAVGHMLTHHLNGKDSHTDILQFGTSYTSNPGYSDSSFWVGSHI